MNLDALHIRWIFYGVLVLVISVAFHEFGHAIVAYKLGDDTPRRQGRVTLNPLAHIDLIGTLLLPFAAGVHAATSSGAIGGGGFGWGKPVQHQPRNYTKRISMGVGRILVSIAGPAMNIVLALLLTIINTILLSTHAIAYGGEAHELFAFAVQTNFILFFFNLLPIPPLDGGHIAEYFVPYRHRDTWDNISKFGWFAILAIAMIPMLAQVFVVPARFCAIHLYQLFGIA